MIKIAFSLASMVLLLLAPAASARPLPRFDLSQLAVGTVMEWETDRGLRRMTFLGPDGDLYKFHLQLPIADGAPLEADGWFTQGGQGTRITTGGRNIIVAPHDCGNTVGHCTYTATFSPTRMVQFEYFGVYFDDGIMMFTRKSITSDDPVYREKMCSILDENGASIVNYSILNGDTIQWARRINSPYEAEIESMMARVEARCSESLPNS